MSNHLPFFSVSSSSRSNFLLFVVVLVVIVVHFLLLGIGTLWNPVPPTPKTRSKVVVQTIHLKPLQSVPIQNPTPSSLIQQETASTPISEQPKGPSSPVLQPIQEEIPPIQEVHIKKEEPPPPAVFVSRPVKTESPPLPKTPALKPAFQETPKANVKQPVIKKPVDQAKKAKEDALKSKQAEEAEKKKQQEKAEIERKRQQQIVEAERKRQQEIAAAQEAARQKEQALLAKAKETLAKISETRNKVSSSPSVNLENTVIPKELSHLQVDALTTGEIEKIGEWGTNETSYSDEVAYRLKMALKLPDYGEVRVKLTLDRTGKVVKVDTVQSESKKNQAYVESKIPTLLFPSFGQRFQGVSHHTFVFTLQNDF